VWDKDYSESLFGPEGILSDEIVDTLASVGPIVRLAELERVVGSQWAWFGQYGDSLLEALLGMSIPALIPKDPKPRGTKRPQAALQEKAGKAATSSDKENERPVKKSRVDAQETTTVPTPVMGVPTNSTYTTPFHSSTTSTAAWIPPAHSATPQSSRILPSTTSSGPFTPSTVTPMTPMAYYPPYSHNPYSSLMHQPPQYYTPYTYHMPTFYSPYTTPNQGRTLSQMPDSSSSSHSKTSISALPNSFRPK